MKNISDYLTGTRHNICRSNPDYTKYIYQSKTIPESYTIKNGNEKRRLLSTAEIQKIREDNPSLKLQEERLAELKTLRTQLKEAKGKPEDSNRVIELSEKYKAKRYTAFSNERFNSEQY